MELVVGALVVLGLLAILIRLIPRDVAGRVVLPRIVDDSIGMWVLRRLTGRTLGEHPDDRTARSNSVATATAEPARPGGSAASQPGDSSPLVRRTALAAPSFAATPSRLAAAGVLRAPKASGRSARTASIGPRFWAAVGFRAALMTTEAVQGPAHQGPQTVLERRSPVARQAPAAVRTWSVEHLGWAPRREIGVTATPRARSSGVAGVRPTIAGLATVLTFGVIGLVAIAAASVPESHRTPILDAGGRPEATQSPWPSHARPSAPSATP